MADLVETMTRSSDTAQSWHGKENIIPADAPFDDWFAHSGLNYKVLRSRVRYATSREDGFTEGYATMDDRHVLFRSDTLAPLSVVSSDYNVVQPRDVLEFYRELCEANSLKMDTAGVLAKGKRVWALARTGNEVKVGGSGSNDLVKQYVLLATSYDATMATIAKHTSVRVVCNNTLTMAANNKEPAIRVLHSSKFDPTAVKLDLGLLDSEFKEFGEYASLMHSIPIDMPTAARWYAELLLDKTEPVTDQEVADMLDNRVLKGLLGAFYRAPGNEATAWGLVNGATFMVDHVRGRGYDTRMNAAWFGQGDVLKRKAWAKAAEIIDQVKRLSAPVEVA